MAKRMMIPMMMRSQPAFIPVIGFGIKKAWRMWELSWVFQVSQVTHAYRFANGRLPLR